MGCTWGGCHHLIGIMIWFAFSMQARELWLSTRTGQVVYRLNIVFLFITVGHKFFSFVAVAVAVAAAVAAAVVLLL